MRARWALGAKTLACSASNLPIAEEMPEGTGEIFAAYAAGSHNSTAYCATSAEDAERALELREFWNSNGARRERG